MAIILVCDDSQFMRSTIKMILEESGHKVVAEARNGREAVDFYRQFRPDIVTMDVNIPVFSGIEATKMICKEFLEAKIIIVSSMGQKWYKEDAVEAGAKGFLVKPFSVREMLSIVNSFAIGE